MMKFLGPAQSPVFMQWMHSYQGISNQLFSMVEFVKVFTNFNNAHRMMQSRSVMHSVINFYFLGYYSLLMSKN